MKNGSANDPSLTYTIVSHRYGNLAFTGSSFKKVVSAIKVYCMYFNVDISAHRFFYKGKWIDADDTPCSLYMNNGDVVNVYKDGAQI